LLRYWRESIYTKRDKKEHCIDARKKERSYVAPCGATTEPLETLEKKVIDLLAPAASTIGAGDGGRARTKKTAGEGGAPRRPFYACRQGVIGRRTGLASPAARAHRWEPEHGGGHGNKGEFDGEQQSAAMCGGVPVSWEQRQAQGIEASTMRLRQEDS
jgi:hypothetical protein